MTISHYIEIQLSKLAIQVQLDVKEIYRKLHSIIGKSEGKIGVSFPDWTDTHIGSIIRFFGPEEQLQFISRCSWLNEMAENGYIVVSRVKKTPEIQEYIRFYRNRRIEKNGEKYFNRIQKRSLAYFSRENIQNKDVLSPNTYERNCAFHNIVMKSGSTKQTCFSLNIVKESVQKQMIDLNAKFSSYGLGQSGVGVPNF